MAEFSTGIVSDEKSNLYIEALSRASQASVDGGKFSVMAVLGKSGKGG